MENKLKDLLDLTYEMEALLHLALKREECRYDLLRLIAKKGTLTTRICDEISFPENIESPEKKAVEESNEMPESFHLDEYTIPDDEVPLYYESSLELPDTELTVTKQYEPTPLSQFREDSMGALPVNETKKEDKGKLVFSINDRFRFKKELFGNSDVDFNNSLALVASMDDYDEAEYYFINDIGLNPSDSTVGDFLDIVKRYFS